MARRILRKQVWFREKHIWFRKTNGCFRKNVKLFLSRLVGHIQQKPTTIQARTKLTEWKCKI